MAIDLFSGAGGLSHGLELSGFKVVAANEIHKDPIKTYRKNHPGTLMIDGDIRTMDGKDILASINEEAGLDIRQGELDLIAGGPPCQGFSTAGLKIIGDPRNSLIAKYIEILKEIQPRRFLIENVPGLVSLHGGRNLDMVLDLLSTTGYEFNYKILHASDYGVPQQRKRLFILGSREGRAPSMPKPTHCIIRKGQKNLEETGLLPCPTIGETISDLPELEPGEKKVEYDRPPKSKMQRELRGKCTTLYNHEATRHGNKTVALFSLFKEGGTQRDLPRDPLTGKPPLKKNIQRWDRDGISRAITSEPTDFIHYSQPRIPTIREMARLQTYPDEYEFLGQRTAGNENRRFNYCAQSQQVGNSVPPFLARAVGRALLDSLE